MADPFLVLAVEVQNALEDDGEEPPSEAQLTHWARSAYTAVSQRAAELTIRLVGEVEMRQLNQNYRGQAKTTNVLSFGVDIPDGVELEIPPLGDVLLCHPVLVREATDQSKPLNNHYAHLVAHGVLHLCGYDHLDSQQAAQMEALEIDILARQGVRNPYQ